MINPLANPYVEYESEAYPNNILRIELHDNGTSVLSAYDSKHERTALSYISLGQTLKGGHA